MFWQLLAVTMQLPRILQPRQRAFDPNPCPNFCVSSSTHSYACCKRWAIAPRYLFDIGNIGSADVAPDDSAQDIYHQDIHHQVPLATFDLLVTIDAVFASPFCAISADWIERSSALNSVERLVPHRVGLVESMPD